MAEITDAEAIKFCNERCRILADAIESTDRTLTQFMLDVVLSWESVAEVIAADNADVIVDGSEEDGRHTNAKINVAELKYVVEQLQACMATDDRREVVHRWACNGRPKF